jgi:hypothetical protein
MAKKLLDNEIKAIFGGNLCQCYSFNEIEPIWEGTISDDKTETEQVIECMHICCGGYKDQGAFSYTIGKNQDVCIYHKVVFDNQD